MDERTQGEEDSEVSTREASEHLGEVLEDILRYRAPSARELELHASAFLGSIGAVLRDAHPQVREGLLPLLPLTTSEAVWLMKQPYVNGQVLADNGLDGLTARTVQWVRGSRPDWASHPPGIEKKERGPYDGMARATAQILLGRPPDPRPLPETRRAETGE